ncbi:anaerobic ribonucleoside-triphosphate reductase activating protein [Desulfovibrio aminophilus]|nr:anaerobic ribonucleoside-triphosphate reductase activating protein [Desulfovibrio aminophilus]MCM0756836.1 anaerobic ribonucleoside-triphosphate reductase activating protein [Desulfovibrio aminophilus]
MEEHASIWNHLRGLQRLSLCDWPGRSCCVIFLGGCNFRCPTCHNFELAWNMESQPLFARSKLLLFLAERKRWLDGVTITGGEATCAPGLGELLHAIHKIGLPVKLDSNGMRPDVLAEALEAGLAAHCAVDVKGPYAKYPALSGGCVTAEAARTNLESVFALAERRPGAFSFRLTRVPGLTGDDIETARGYLPAGHTLTLQTYRAPRRAHAHADHEARRPVGNVVNG